MFINIDNTQIIRNYDSERSIISKPMKHFFFVIKVGSP